MQTLSCSVWDLVPWSEVEPCPLLWERGVLTTGPPGKSLRLYFLFFFNHLFVYCLFWLRCASMALCRLFSLLLWWAEAILHCGAWAFAVAASLGRGFRGCSAQTLGCGLSSCGAGASLPWGTWNLPGPTIEPCCGGRQILITVPPGKSPSFVSWISISTFFLLQLLAFSLPLLAHSFPDSAASAVIWVHKEALLAAAWLLSYFLGELWPNGGNESPITALLFTLLAHVGLTS